MRSPVVVAAAVFAGLLVGQAPPDLEAIAKLLEGDGKLVDPVAPLRSGDRQMFERALVVGALVTADERDMLLEEGLSQYAAVPVAVRVLVDSLGQPTTRLGLLREIQACALLGSAASYLGDKDALLGNGKSMWPEVERLAEHRAGALCARFLRQYPEAPEVGHFLTQYAALAGKRDAPAIRETGLRILGPDATIRDHLTHVRDRLREGSLSEAEQALAAAERARPGRTLERRAYDANALAQYRCRIAAARQLEGWAQVAGLDGRIAHLRWLQQTDSTGAVELAKELAAEGVAHALPSAILAADASNRGPAAMKPHVDRARQLPGADSYTAVLALVMELVVQAAPVIRQQRDADAGDAQQVEQCMRDFDSLVKEEQSEIAILWRGFRAMGMCAGSEASLLMSPESQLELHAACPGAEAPIAFALAAASSSADPERGLAVVRRVKIAGAASTRKLHGMRAAVLVQLALAADGDGPREEAERALADLERVQGDNLDANYLRGVLAWSRAVRPGAPPELRQEAMQHFVRSKRMAFEEGAFPAALGACLAAEGRVSADQASELQRVKNVSGADAEHLVPYAVFVLQRERSPGTIEAAGRLREGVRHPLFRWALSAAIAEAHQELGDAAAARVAAKQALAEDVSAPRELLATRGVLVMGQCRMKWNADLVGARCACDACCELLPIPPLPPRERLQQLARD